MRKMRRNTLMLVAGIVIAAFGATPSRAQTPTTHTVDFNLTPQPAGNTFDGADNPGQFWTGGPLVVDPPVTLNVGDTISGTVTFTNVAGLEVADNGGGFFAIPGSFTGFERFLVLMRGTGNITETRQHSSSIEFLGVTGTPGTPIENPITRSGGFSSDTGAVEFVQNMVDGGNRFSFSGFKYSYTLVAAETPLNINSISFRIGAESIERVCAPPAPVSTDNPIVIDFEGLAHEGGIVSVLSPYSEDGYTVTSVVPAGTPDFTVFGCADPRFPGSTALAAGTVPATWTLTNDNDEPFDLVSIDISEWQTPFFGSGLLTYTGTKSDLVTTVTHSFTLDGQFGPETITFPSSFSGLVSVSVSITSSGEQYHQIDNITVSPSPFPESTLTGDALASACIASTNSSTDLTPPYIVGVTIGRTDLGPIAGKGPEIATCEDTFPDTAPRLEVCSRSPTGPNPCFDPATLPFVTGVHGETVAVVRRSPDSTVHCFDVEGFLVCVDFSSPTSP